MILNKFFNVILAKTHKVSTRSEHEVSARYKIPDSIYSPNSTKKQNKKRKKKRRKVEVEVERLGKQIARITRGFSILSNSILLPSAHISAVVICILSTLRCGLREEEKLHKECREIYGKKL